MVPPRRPPPSAAMRGPLAFQVPESLRSQTSSRSSLRPPQRQGLARQAGLAASGPHPIPGRRAVYTAVAPRATASLTAAARVSSPGFSPSTSRIFISDRRRAPSRRRVRSRSTIRSCRPAVAKTCCPVRPSSSTRWRPCRPAGRTSCQTFPNRFDVRIVKGVDDPDRLPAAAGFGVIPVGARELRRRQSAGWAGRGGPAVNDVGRGGGGLRGARGDRRADQGQAAASGVWGQRTRGELRQARSPPTTAPRRWLQSCRPGRKPA